MASIPAKGQPPVNPQRSATAVSWWPNDLQDSIRQWTGSTSHRLWHDRCMISGWVSPWTGLDSDLSNLVIILQIIQGPVTVCVIVLLLARKGIASGRLNVWNFLKVHTLGVQIPQLNASISFGFTTNVELMFSHWALLNFHFANLHQSEGVLWKVNCRSWQHKV